MVRNLIQFRIRGNREQQVLSHNTAKIHQNQTRPGKKMTEERDAGKRRLCLMAGICLKFCSFHLQNLDKQT